jgi:NAD(P)-dependent dehydrogenase (short-subunit alcohol dehydrogenase family)
MRLENKVCVVTGATSGIGLAIAWAFAREGAKLILNSRRPEACQELTNELRSSGATTSFVAGDVADPRTGEAIAQAARTEHGRVDVVVLNAGIGVPGVGPFWDVEPSEFDQIFATNVRGVWLCARAVAPLMERGASMVVMASMASHVAYPGESIYSASKGAVLQLARGMAIDLAERGVRVNALCPGIIDTPFTRWFLEQADDPEALEAEYHETSPLGRMGTAEEMASAALYLASDESSYTTGASLVCDGGVLIR